MVEVRGGMAEAGAGGRGAASMRAERMPGSPTRLVWAFHVVAGAAAGCVLCAVSYPGLDFLLLAVGGVLALAVGGGWLGWVVAVAVRTRRLWPWFAAGPGIAVVCGVLLVARVPLDARWAASRGAFAAVVAGHPIPPAGSEWASLTVPDRLGLYRVPAAYWVPGGAIFYEAHGDFLDDAGFAYLPAGPTAELNTVVFESPRFRALGGGWYRWTASW